MFPLLLTLVAPNPAPPPPADEAVHRVLAAEAKRLSENVLAGAKTRADWEAKRPQLKAQFLDMLGLRPLPAKTPLKATVTGTFDHAGVTVENLHYQSVPGLYVTANLYRPKAAAGRLPAILYVCGHSNRGRDGNKTAFQDHGAWFAKNGYVCLVVDTLQLGEAAGRHHGTYNLNRFWWQCRGYTPAGVECWNGIRGIDYLCSRPDVDPEKIGVTGISGGGATTVWVATADDRVKVAVPVSGMSDLESYVGDRVVNGHCDCMFFVNTYRWEWTTALALFAPKPLLFANSDSDRIFPMDGNRRIVARLRTAYDLYGAKDKVDEHVSPGGHDYRPDLRLAVFRFFHTHLKGDTAKVTDAEDPKIPGQQLRAFPADADLPKDAINDRIDESFVPAADLSLPSDPAAFPVWKKLTLGKLRRRSFRPLPETVAPIKLAPDEAPGSKATAVSPDGLDVSALTLAVNNPGTRTALVVLNPEEDPIAAQKFWLDKVADLKVMIAVSPRGVGAGAWTRKNPPNTVERSLALLGDTADAGRVRDVAGVLAGRPGKVVLAGRGSAGVIAAYAALFAPGTVEQLLVSDPPPSHRGGPYFLGVQRVLDVPDALGLLAPDVPLTLLDAKDKAFDRTAAAYKLAGQPGRLKRE